MSNLNVRKWQKKKVTLQRLWIYRDPLYKYYLKQGMDILKMDHEEFYKSQGVYIGCQ